MAQIFSVSVQKLNNLEFCGICGYKKKVKKQIFYPLLFFLLRDLGSEIRDPVDKNQDPG